MVKLVTHSVDICIKKDYLWFSMRKPSCCTPSASAHTYFKYADDTELVGFLKSDNSSGFEKETGIYSGWRSGIFLEVNIKKTKEMVIDFRS